VPGHRQPDFLIGEEPLDGDVGFFASSADAVPPAAADTIVEITPGQAAGSLLPGRGRGRGSTVALPSAKTRRLTAGTLLALGVAFAAVVAVSASTARKETPRPTQRHGIPMRSDRAGISHDNRRRGARTRARRPQHAALAGGLSEARHARMRSAEASRYERPSTPQPQVPEAARVAPAEFAADPATVGRAAAAAGARGEFDFER
jgi:hypothetical protein